MGNMLLGAICQEGEGGLHNGGGHTREVATKDELFCRDDLFGCRAVSDRQGLGIQIW